MEESRLRFGAIIGSLRRNSLNRWLFETLVGLAPQSIEVHEIPIGALPLFNQDLEADLPPEVGDFRDAIRLSDGVLFVSPEYNYSIPGIVKNAIDWASWPQDRPALAGKPGALLGASPGRSGTMRAQLALRQMLPYCNVHLMNKPEVFIPFAMEKFDEHGRLTDRSTADQLQNFLSGFEAWVRFLGSESHPIRQG